MTDRRSLVEGLKQTPPPIDSKIEKDFVFQEKPASNSEGTTSTANPTATQNAQTIAKAPISTRIRADLAAALKRASLERQLSGIEPNSVQDILEQAIEPWLRTNGYLS